MNQELLKWLVVITFLATIQETRTFNLQSILRSQCQRRKSISLLSTSLNLRVVSTSSPWLFELKSSSNNPSIPTSIHIQKQRLGLESSGKSSSFLEYETSCIALTKEMQWLLRTSSTLINTDEVTSEYEYPVGTLPPNLIRKFPMIMKAWAQRCSIPHLRSNAA